MRLTIPRRNAENPTSERRITRQAGGEHTARKPPNTHERKQHHERSHHRQTQRTRPPLLRTHPPHTRRRRRIHPECPQLRHVGMRMHRQRHRQESRCAPQGRRRRTARHDRMKHRRPSVHNTANAPPPLSERAAAQGGRAKKRAGIPRRIGGGGESTGMKIT